MIDQSGSASGTFGSLGNYFNSFEAIEVVIDDAGNQPPSVTLANPTTALAEDVDTTAPIKVAAIVVTDDALGTNALSLSGADAELFEIVGTELYLKAGVSLDHDSQSQLDLDNASVAENLAGAIVGTLTTTDPDGDTVFTYTVDDTRFEVVGSQRGSASTRQVRS